MSPPPLLPSSPLQRDGTLALVTVRSLTCAPFDLSPEDSGGRWTQLHRHRGRHEAERGVQHPDAIRTQGVQAVSLRSLQPASAREGSIELL